jgi:hypothetical protein
MHDLAAEYEYMPIENTLHREIFKWSVAGPNFLPWKKDAQFPEADFESPEEQLKERLPKSAR